MNIVGTSNSKNIVSLEQLVPQHDCLKLLILHTPYTLVIDTLNLCVNLVKLDLSKNNLENFPYLGNLKNLKFMFIHQNKLDVTVLRNIFELNGKKSNLSENIVWVTFWGNKNAFLGRHYLANQTSAIAIDKNMVVQQEKSPEFPMSYFEPFGQETYISSFFSKKGSVNRFASEEQYMRQLWLEMAGLRKKHEKLFPIIKIQKVFRGWMVRVNSNRKNRDRHEFINILKKCFMGWKLHTKRQVKLQRILKQKRKDYLLLDLKEMRKQEKVYKMVEIARQVKMKFFKRKFTLKNQLRFYNIIRKNYLLLKNLYQELEVAKSTAVYIHKNQWQLFIDNVEPYIRLINPSKVVESKNQRFCLHLLYQFFNDTSKEFIKMMQTNMKSMAYQSKYTPNVVVKKGRKPLLYGCRLKQIYTSTHIATSKKIKLELMVERLELKRQIGLGELIKVEGNQLLLKDIVRGVYFFNTGRLQGSDYGNERINLFTEYSLKTICAVTKIQKIWRGFSFRKKNENNLKVLLKVQRATIIIQRWFRKFPMAKKKNFIYSAAKRLQQVRESVFYIEIGDYFNFLSEKQSKLEKPIFQELDSRVYIHSESSTLSLTWNNRSQDLQIGENIRLKKWLFNRKFLKEKVGLTDDQINVKLVYDSTKHQPCSYAHIFHFGTESSIINRAKKRYLQVKCPSKNQAKFRIFILLVCSYQIKAQNQLNIYFSSHFRLRDIATKKAVGKSQTNFICNQNFDLIKQCQIKFRNEPAVKLHVITNKFYFQSEEKTLKIKEKFFIYTYFADDIEKKQAIDQTKEVKQQKRYVTEPAKTQQGHFRLLTENDTDGVIMNKNSQPTKMKILIKKRSVKQYKIDKKGKNKKKDQPNFVLDSVSMNDRLTTQPDIILTQMSNQQNNSIDHNFQHASLEKNDIKLKQRLTYIQKRNHSFKRKQDDNFTKRFVNLGNFIQNQYANDYRRRIKTELQNRAVDSAQQVRRQIERSQSQKIQETQEKHKKIREKHSQHRELVQKTQSLMREHSLQIKNEVIESRDKKLKEKSKLKRLKVSFAEQCYPLASRNRKNEYFP